MKRSSLLYLTKQESRRQLLQQEGMIMHGALLGLQLSFRS